MRILLRNSWAAAAGFLLIYTAFLVPLNNAPVLAWLYVGLLPLGWFILITRFGLLAFAAAIFVRFFLVRLPITADLDAWYLGGTLFGFAVVLAVAAYGFYTSLAGQALFREKPAAR
jgi:hypothetical protein